MTEAELRRFVRSRAAGFCEYCKLPDSFQFLPFHVEHVIARQHGGPSDEVNLAWACGRCNAYKGPNLSSIDPITGDVVTLFRPRHDIWNEHFDLVHGRVMGRTSRGRATVRLLQMNSRRRIELRREIDATDEP